MNRIDDFEMLTKEAGHPWVRIDLKGSLARWLASVDAEELVESGDCPRWVIISVDVNISSG